MNPLAGLYGAGTALRNKFFDRGTLPARQLKQPVVSVGNVSAGGSGKTPFVIALGELLKERGVSFDVLSRGYRRQTRGVLVVDPGGNASDFGDEPLLIARKLGVPVIVGASRYQAGIVAEQNFQTQLHILDDGFQHRSLARDFDIVLVTDDDFKDRLLPTGRLREPLTALQRADAIILPQGLTTEHPALRDKPVWRMQRAIQIYASNLESSSRPGTPSRYGPASAQAAASRGAANSPDAAASRESTASAVPLATTQNGGFSPSQPPSPVVFCGIARPQQFFAQVRAAGITPGAEIAFRDHHRYDLRDLQLLLERRRESGASGFLTTEKDAINLGPLRADLEPLYLAVLRLTLDRPADLVDTILTRIATRKPRS